MSRVQKDLLITLGYAAFIVGILAATLAANYFAANWRCGERWKDSGYESNYKAFVGCQIKVDGKWLPDGLIREIAQ